MEYIYALFPTAVAKVIVMRQPLDFDNDTDEALEDLLGFIKTANDMGAVGFYRK